MAAKITFNLTPEMQKRILDAFEVEIAKPAIEAAADEARRLLAVHGPEHSKPGEPPHTQTGELLGAIGTAIRRRPGKLTAYLGVVKGHGRAVQEALAAEFGTHKEKPRPFLRPAIANTFQRIGGILGRVYGGKH